MPQKTIVFDLGGVLLREAEINLAKVLPLSVVNSYPHNKVPLIFNRIFEFVDLVSGQECKRAWLLGTLSGVDVVRILKDYAERPEYAHFFHDAREKELIIAGAPYIVVPELLASLTKLNQEGYNCVQRCKQQDLQIMILSNWDPTSFTLIQDKFPQLFDLFDQQDIVLPYKVGFIKPECQVFEYMRQQLRVDFARTIFIDDSLRNVEGAQKCGVAGIVHHDWATTERELQARGLLQG